MVSAVRELDVQQVIDAHPMSPLQRRLLALCFLVVAIDGFDVAVVGHIAPSLRSEWSLAVTSLGPLFAAGLFGLALGSLVVGPLADRFGRKTMLVTSVVCFGVASIVSAFSSDLSSLIWLRFVTGVGLGGAMPTAITLTSEYCPSARRSSLVTLMFCGFTIGSAIGGLTAAHMVTAYGWRSLLVLGGVLPLMLAVVLAGMLPESVRYLASRRDGKARVQAILQRIAPSSNFDDAVFAEQRSEGTSPLRGLFRPDLAYGTVLLWVSFFMTLLVVYLLSNWMPTLIQRAGLSLRGASLITATFQLGGTAGAIVLGRLMDRLSQHRVLAAAYLIAAAFIVLMGLTAETPWLMAVAVFGAGFCVSGGQVGANALAAAFYPTSCRTTGVSWALGIGRVGSIVGSLMGGALLAQGWGMGTVYGLVAIPAVFSALAIGGMGRFRERVG